MEGRLFADAGRLHLVVEANEETGIGRVSCRIDGEQRVIEMPVSEVARQISCGSDMTLDNTRGPDARQRLLQRSDGWFFSVRDGGLKGPYASGEEAERELGQYIIAAQSAVAVS